MNNPRSIYKKKQLEIKQNTRRSTLLQRDKKSQIPALCGLTNKITKFSLECIVSNLKLNVMNKQTKYIIYNIKNEK